jgi:cytochrome c
MNSFEINKYLGALLGTCLVLMAIHLASGAIFYSPAPAKPGYEVAVKEEKAGHGEAAKAAEVPIETLLASAAPATTSKKARAPRSAPIFTAWSDARSPPSPASTTRPH